MKGSTPLAKTLTQLMEEHGISAKDLAEKAQVSRSTLGGWRHGTHPHDFNDVRRVAHALGCSFEYLVFGEDDQNLKRVIQEAPAEVTMEGLFRIKIEKVHVDKYQGDREIPK